MSEAFEVERLDHVALRVADLGRSVEFYQRVLGLRDAFPGMWGGVPTILLTAGPGARTGVALFPAGGGGGPPARGTAGVVDHVAFAVPNEEFERALRHLDREGVEFTRQQHGIASSVYFEDPDGHRLEITTYPEVAD